MGTWVVGVGNHHHHKHQNDRIQSYKPICQVCSINSRVMKLTQAKLHNKILPRGLSWSMENTVRHLGKDCANKNNCGLSTITWISPKSFFIVINQYIFSNRGGIALLKHAKMYDSSYLWKGFNKLYHQFPFVSFLIFSFLALDKICKSVRKERCLLPEKCTASTHIY